MVHDELVKCIEEDNIHQLKLLSDMGYDLFETGEDGSTLLHVAAHSNSINCAELLIKKGLDLDRRFGARELTPFMVAVKNDAVDITRILIDNGVKLSFKKNVLRDMIDASIVNDSVPVLRLLLQQYDLHNSKNIRRFKKYLVESLNKKHSKISLKIKNLMGLSEENFLKSKLIEHILLYATKNGSAEVVEFLLNSVPSLSVKKNKEIEFWDNNETLILLAIESDHVDVALKFFKHFNFTDEVKNKALFVACKNDAAKIAIKLLEKGADINTKDEYGETPLFDALRNNSPNLARLLIDHGADDKIKNNNEISPFIFAVQTNCTPIVEYFLKRGACVNERDLDGNTPLFYAHDENSVEIVELLISNGALVNTRNNHGHTPLFWAVSSNSKKTAECLVKNGAIVYIEDHYGRSLLDMILEKGMDEILLYT